ncbi:MAG: tetratricopeptide repeat protein [Verrucomicrobiota bacterium]
MNSEEDIFEHAAALPQSDRAAYLDAACAGQPELRRRMEALLRSHEVTGFMQDHTVVLTGPPAEQTGERIGRYRLLQQIGEGGFGTVWMAEQVEPVTRRVALKIIKAGMDTKEVIARFEAERQALAMMDHPNIAKVFDAGATDEGRPFFVMELVKGIPITRFCDEQQFTTRQRLELFGDVCSAINHAHQKGIIHRDIKPSNVMVTLNADRPVVKVIDFGIAKATQGKLTDRTLFTRFEQFVGTPAYMSPEQAAISELDIDTRSDIYALGVLLYELLTGKPPFDAKTLVSAGYEEMRRIIREVEPPKPSTRLRELHTAFCPDAPPDKSKILNHQSIIEPDLDWIVMKAIEKERARRYETANGLALDIQRFLADEPVSAGRPTAAYRFRKFARRHKAALRVAALAVVVLVTAAMISTAMIASVLVAATVVSTWLAVRAKTAERRAVQAGKLATTKTADEKSAREDAEAVSKFLTEAFDSPDPTRDGRTITVAEMLDRAAKKVQADFIDQPARRAKFQAALGRTYHALGLYHEAIRLEELARDYFHNQGGKESNDTLNAMSDLANSYHSAGRLEDALNLREEVLSIRRKLNGAEHSDTIQSLSEVAESFEYAGRVNDSLKLREDALDLRRRVNGEKHAETIWATHCVAMSYMDSGRYLEALKLEQQVLALGCEVYDPEHPRMLAAMHILAHCLAEIGSWDEAVRMWEKEYEGRKMVNGVEHADTIECMADLAHARYSAGRVDDAIELLEHSVAIHRKTLGRDHFAAVTRTVQLAYTYLSAGRPAEAQSSLVEIAAPRLSDIFTLDGPIHFIEITALCAWFDMDTDFSANSRRALELAATTRDPAIAERAAKGFCLRPFFDPDLLATALTLARRAVELGQKEQDLPWYQLALGIAELRQGNYSVADSALLAAERGATPQPYARRQPLFGTAKLYRAISLFRQSRFPEARELFLAVEEQMNPLPCEGRQLKNVAFHNDLICWLAYKEAKALLFPNQ